MLPNLDGWNFIVYVSMYATDSEFLWIRNLVEYNILEEKNKGKKLKPELWSCLHHRIE